MTNNGTTYTKKRHSWHSRASRIRVAQDVYSKSEHKTDNLCVIKQKVEVALEDQVEWQIEGEIVPNLLLREPA